VSDAAMAGREANGAASDSAVPAPSKPRRPMPPLEALAMLRTP
jgi:hypothetical protein